MDSDSPVELCVYCCKFLFQIHRFRIRCENIQKKLQVHCKAMQNKHKNVETRAQNDTKIQIPEKPNESIVPVIKEENSTDDTEMAWPAQNRIANSDDGENTSLSAVEKFDYDSEMLAVKTETISMAAEDTTSAIKEEVITDDYESVKIAISNNSESAEPNEQVDSQVAKDRVKDKFTSKNNTMNDIFESDSSGLESDEERYDVKIRNWQCEYDLDEEQVTKTCKLCNGQFIHFEKHISSCPKHNVICCKYCTLYFRSTTDLEKHMEQIHEDWIPCTICFTSFLGYNTLLEHTRVHSTLKCLKCHMEFNSHESIANHNATLHAKIINEKCPICTQNCATEFEFNNHIKTAHDDNFHSCEDCGSVFRYFFEKVAHDTSHHIHRCDLCKAVFRHESFLKFHKRWHKSNKMKLSCQFCDRKFITIASYEIHMQYHDYQEKIKPCYSRMHSPTPNKFPENLCLRCNEKFKDLKGHLEICRAPITRQYVSLFNPKTDKVYRSLKKIIERREAQGSFGSKFKGHPMKKTESTNRKIPPVESRNESTSNDTTSKVYANKRQSKNSYSQ